MTNKENDWKSNSDLSLTERERRLKADPTQAVLSKNSAVRTGAVVEEDAFNGLMSKVMALPPTLRDPKNSLRRPSDVRPDRKHTDRPQDQR
jgi:hypothetical protein